MIWRITCRFTSGGKLPHIIFEHMLGSELWRISGKVLPSNVKLGKQGVRRCPIVGQIRLKVLMKE